MKCFVTGASGFVGANLVHELLARGHEVRALLRQSSDGRSLAGLDLERVEIDLTDAAGLAGVMRGCDWCFHVAASYHLWLRDYSPMYVTNVEGTRAVLSAARQAGCARIVHTSTVGCMGLPRRLRGRVVPTDETAEVDPRHLANPYKRSKWQAEQLAIEFAGQGWPVVIVNPSAPIGPRDTKPTPTGQVMVDFMNGRMPAYLDTGLNWVHVKDVAIGHILAAERGRPGDRYILGHKEGNWTMKRTLKLLSELTGRPAPQWRIPYWVAWTVAVMSEMVSSVTHQPPRAPLGGVRMARHLMFFDPSKAVRELGLPQTPPRQAFAEAIAWFQEHGYVSPRPRTPIST